MKKHLIEVFFGRHIFLSKSLILRTLDQLFSRIIFNWNLQSVLLPNLLVRIVIEEVPYSEDVFLLGLYLFGVA